MTRRRVLIVLSVLALAAVLASVLRPLRRSHPLEGELAPDFTLPLVGHADNERVKLSDQRGKVVVLDFWAGWCEPCRHGIPLFNKASEKFGEKLLVLGVNSEQHDANVLGHIAKNWGFRYSTVHDQALEAQLAYQVQVLPTVVIIDREGIVRRVYPGEPTEQALFDQIAKYLD